MPFGETEALLKQLEWCRPRNSNAGFQFSNSPCALRLREIPPKHDNRRLLQMATVCFLYGLTYGNITSDHDVMNSTMVVDKNPGERSAASQVQPTSVEFFVLLAICSIVSFRIFALIAIPIGFVAFCRTRRTVLRYLVMAAMVGVFAIPVDIRLANASTHHGESKQFATVLPTFTGHHTAHSVIRRKHSEYYTSLIINRPRYVLSLDFGRL